MEPGAKAHWSVLGISSLGNTGSYASLTTDSVQSPELTKMGIGLVTPNSILKDPPLLSMSGT